MHRPPRIRIGSKISSVLAVRFCLATVFTAYVSCSEMPSNSSLILAPSTLNSNSSLYDGKIVEVKGFVILAPEAHVLYESKELHEEMAKGYDPPINGRFDPKPYLKYCLTIENPDFFYKNAALFDRKIVVLKGKFDQIYLHDNEIDLGACALRTGIFVDIDDLRTRYHTESKRS
jgi:hypothetical protein